MLIDESIVAASESAIYGILKAHDLLGRFTNNKTGAQKEYFNKPLFPHHHWHVDLAYIKILGIFYFMILLLDGYSRFLLHWDLMTDMRTQSVELFILETKEKYSNAKPKLIHDNGSQFIAKDFKSLASRLEIQQVFTRRNHPQTNGKLERMNGIVKQEAIRPNAPTSYQEAFQILNTFSYEYNYQRLHSGINYLRPSDMFFGREKEILKERKLKLELARIFRKNSNQNDTLHVS